MLNTFMLVGRYREIKDNILTIAVSRTYKNIKGEYETDMIPVYIYGEISKNVKAYCHRGDVLGVKGRIESNGKLIVEKVSFLTAKQNK